MTQRLVTLTDARRSFAGPAQGFLGGERPRVQAVAGVSLAIDPGEALGLVGESGCGKSTLGRLVQGLERPDGGTVLVDGTPPTADRRTHARRVQTIYQNPLDVLDPRLKVAEAVAEPLEIHRLGTRETRAERVMRLLRDVELPEELALRYPHELSGGQAQRVVIARALALEPQVIVCDEPVASLDAPIQRQILRLLDRLRRDLGLSYLFISHDLGAVWELCQRVAIMYLGRIVEQGPKEEIFLRPRHPYTQALLTAIPRPDAPDAPRAPLLQGEPPSPVNAPPGCAFHPRCAYAQEVCRTIAPALTQTQPLHHTACHFVAPRPTTENQAGEEQASENQADRAEEEDQAGAI
ncbi:MAG TPA: ABC transporter ATP-binding protein [Kiloniellaceae bacterium]|nr:ABC transporter ATP-binding protein [Kiloniellaceae bacterium]